MAIGPYIKGVFILDDGVPIPFLYNPNEIRESRSVNWAKKNGLGMSHPRSQYTGGGDREITFTMVLNNPWDWGGTRIPMSLELYIGSLIDLTYPIHRGGVLEAGPPTITFAFGVDVRRVKIARVDVVKKHWTKYLVLRQAEVSLTLFEVVDESRNRINAFSTYGEA